MNCVRAQGTRHKAQGTHHGQAFIELAIGMLVLSLVLSALFAFAEYAIRDLDVQRELRAEAGKDAMLSVGPTGEFSTASGEDTMELDEYASKYIFGKDSVTITETVHMPYMRN